MNGKEADMVIKNIEFDNDIRNLVFKLTAFQS